MTNEQSFTDEIFWREFYSALGRVREIVAQRSAEYDNGCTFAEKFQDWRVDLLPYIRHKVDRIRSISAAPDLNEEALLDSAYDAIAYLAFLIARVKLEDSESAVVEHQQVVWKAT